MGRWLGHGITCVFMLHTCTFLFFWHDAFMEHKHLNDFSNVSSRVSQLERELACYYAGIAVLLEECFAPGAGIRALGLKERSSYVRLASEIDVNSTDIGRMLPVWVRYAYEGVMSAGYGDAAMDTVAGGSLERLRDMLHLLRADDPYFQLCLDAAQMDLPEDIEFGGLEDLSARVTARHDLDTGSDLTPPQLALLANMTERSVRNAMLAAGELKANASGYVDNAEAKRWLLGRRGFISTTKREFPSNADHLPEALDAVELPPFIRRRLTAVWAGVESESLAQSDPRFPDWVVQASRHSGLAPERVLAGCELPLELRPQDCEMWAKALRVDRVWFTHQVMSALFPEQVDMLLNPGAWQAPEAKEAVSTSAVTVTLTPAMLLHGYIDMPASAAALFPPDSMGTRQEGDTGANVCFLYGAHQADTDIRVKSSKTISPRKRFGAWLNEELNARAGDRIRIEKTGERQYTLSHIAG
jgi:hypothetical protein